MRQGNKRVLTGFAQEAAIYLRLSAADGPAAESDSIQNQRSFLREWAQHHDITIAREFVDDGHTGTDFARPGFQELSQCLMDGSVRCVIVKDYCAIIGLNQKDLENQGILA
ncbi:recombinase family protein [Subdoligranulum variabile]|uniref:Resolvase/invertase-type recombinase catalytic domain-containing protein n=1 Tax=Subdoligranulum variabile DSM 15176 TaxID=411471 RepID=D1PJU4_9FIRM|nr:recombinase family protein [Subdoligranulum variabile]EFB77042.1 hypothetical protein SUBVAR_04664 [Subdoligranulum variabile DSM 15176]UWP67703.1 recombinase family protein [Subdoligranulum variabile]